MIIINTLGQQLQPDIETYYRGNEASVKIDFSPYAPGIYFLRITIPNHNTEVVKIIKY